MNFRTFSRTQPERAASRDHVKADCNPLRFGQADPWKQNQSCRNAAEDCAERVKRVKQSDAPFAKGRLASDKAADDRQRCSHQKSRDQQNQNGKCKTNNAESDERGMRVFPDILINRDHRTKTQRNYDRDQPNEALDGSIEAQGMKLCEAGSKLAHGITSTGQSSHKRSQHRRDRKGRCAKN